MNCQQTLINHIKKILKNQSLEVYFFIIIPLLCFAILLFVKNEQLGLMAHEFSNLVYINAFFGGKLIAWGFIFFYIYLYFKFIYSIAGWVSARFFKSAPYGLFPARRFIVSFGFFSSAIALGGMFLIVYLKLLSFSISHSDMIAASELCATLDQRFLGIDPLLWMQHFVHFTWLDFLLIAAYRNIDLLFGILFIALMLFKKELLRKFLLATFLVPLISLPFWFCIPAVTPFEMYNENIFKTADAHAKQQQYLHAITSPRLKAYLDHLSKTIERPDAQYPLVSTNPSMHVAWGLMICYFSILLWWPVAFLIIPWFLLNCCATMYTFQHYAVDIPMGILFAAVTLLLVHSIFRYEKKYYSGSYPMLYFIDIFQNDMKDLIKACYAMISSK